MIFLHFAESLAGRIKRPFTLRAGGSVAKTVQILAFAVIGLPHRFAKARGMVADRRPNHGQVPMLWTMLRWNAGNTLAIAVFCLLAMLNAVNSAFFLNGADNDRLVADGSACIRLCDNTPQPIVGATRAHVAPTAIALIEPQAAVAD